MPRIVTVASGSRYKVGPAAGRGAAAYNIRTAQETSRMRLVIAVLLLLAGGAQQDDVVKKIVSDADKVKKLTRKISKESRDKIEKALGEKILDADLAPPLWECMSTVPAVSSMSKTKCLVTIVTVKGAKGPIRIGVAAATVETTLHTVKILDNADDKALES